MLSCVKKMRSVQKTHSFIYDICKHYKGTLLWAHLPSTLGLLGPPPSPSRVGNEAQHLLAVLVQHTAALACLCAHFCRVLGREMGRRPHRVALAEGSDKRSEWGGIFGDKKITTHVLPAMAWCHLLVRRHGYTARNSLEAVRGVPAESAAGTDEVARTEW